MGTNHASCGAFKSGFPFFLFTLEMDSPIFARRPGKKYGVILGLGMSVAMGRVPGGTPKTEKGAAGVGSTEETTGGIPRSSTTDSHSPESEN